MSQGRRTARRLRASVPRPSAFVLSRSCISSMPLKMMRALRKLLNHSIGRTTHLISTTGRGHLLARPLGMGLTA
jgi:hypothetical protein